MVIVKKKLKNALVQLAIVASMYLVVYGVPSQTINPVGSYVYKTYRKGKGGFENHLTITKAARDKVHISFEGTYFYMAGRDETFHEGSGEGEGQVNGNVLTATLSEEGGSGTCRITLTFNETLVTNEYTVTVKIKSAECQLNVSPEGLYRKETGSKRKTGASAFANPPTVVTTLPSGFEVCPDPKAPCRSPMREFATFELPFRLPARLKAGKPYNSVPFYAIIVKTYKDEECDADGYTTSIERERLRIQKLYPTRKVFGLYNCPDMDALEYSFPGKMDATGERALIETFIAVYAGKTPAEADEFLTSVQSVFPQALLKRMTASYEIIDQ
jgi:hypothetical protein